MLAPVPCTRTRAPRYFNKSSKLSLKSWEVGQEDAGTPCGHCDNCTRPPDTLERAGTRGRVAAWQVLRVAEDAREGLPLAKLCDRARGLGSATTTSVGKGKGRAREKATVDLERVAGGKVGLTKEVRRCGPLWQAYCLLVCFAQTGGSSWCVCFRC